MITNSCLAFGWSNKPIIFPADWISSNFDQVCSRGYYVAKCGDVDLDLNMILGQIQNIDPTGKCWTEDHYTNMRYLLHLDGNDKSDYIRPLSTFSPDESNILFYNTSAPWYKSDNTCDTAQDSLTQLRTKIYSTCINSTISCSPCPNGGTTDTPTKFDKKTVNGSDVYYWTYFNTIADCYTTTKSDNKGTYEVKYTDGINLAEGKCYYSY